MSICLLLYSSWGEDKHSYSSWGPTTCLLYPRKQWARKQLLTNPSLCMQYRNTHPSGFALGICASILHTNLGNWSITITHVPLKGAVLCTASDLVSLYRMNKPTSFSLSKVAFSMVDRRPFRENIYIYLCINLFKILHREREEREEKEWTLYTCTCVHVIARLKSLISTLILHTVLLLKIRPF